MPVQKRHSHSKSGRYTKRIARSPQGVMTDGQNRSVQAMMSEWDKALNNNCSNFAAIAASNCTLATVTSSDESHCEFDREANR